MSGAPDPKTLAVKLPITRNAYLTMLPYVREQVEIRIRRKARDADLKPIGELEVAQVRTLISPRDTEAEPYWVEYEADVDQAIEYEFVWSMKAIEHVRIDIETGTV